MHVFLKDRRLTAVHFSVRWPTSAAYGVLAGASKLQELCSSRLLKPRSACIFSGHGLVLGGGEPLLSFLERVCCVVLCCMWGLSPT